MLRCVNICLVLGLVALAYVIYEVKYEARALDTEIAGLKKDIEAERDAVSVLRAEWSLLNRPERIERLAQKYLQLGQARPEQLVTLDSVTDGDFERSPAVTAERPSPSASLSIAATEAVPAKTVPAKTVPAKTVPAKTIPAKTIPAETIPAKLVPVKAVSVKAKAKTPILANSVLAPVTLSAPRE